MSAIRIGDRRRKRRRMQLGMKYNAQGTSLWLTLLVALLVASAARAHPGHRPKRPATPPEPPGQGTAGVPDLSGRWVQVLVQTSRGGRPSAGAAKSRVVLVLLVDIEQKGAALELKHTVCDARIQGGSGNARLSIPVELRRAISGVTRGAYLDKSPKSLRFIQPEAIDVWGAALERPAADPLPASAADPRVADSDGDGHPGVSIRVEGPASGTLHLVLRTRTALAGKLNGEGLVNGQVSWATERVVLGASNPALALPEQGEPVPRESFFRMARVEPRASCADVEERVGQLFIPLTH